MSTQPPSNRSSNATVALWACGGLLGLNLLLGISGIHPVEAAFAQQSSKDLVDPPFNAAEQRKRMIEQLTIMNDRLTRLESKLDKGISVKVTEMPAIKVEAPSKE